MSYASSSDSSKGYAFFDSPLSYEDSFCINAVKRFFDGNIRKVHLTYMRTKQELLETKEEQRRIYQEIKKEGGCICNLSSDKWIGLLECSDDEDSSIGMQIKSAEDFSWLFKVLDKEDLPPYIGHDLKDDEKTILLNRISGKTKQIKKRPDLIKAFEKLNRKRGQSNKKQRICKSILLNYAFYQLYNQFHSNLPFNKYPEKNDAFFELKFSDNEIYRFIFKEEDESTVFLDPSSTAASKEIK